MKKLSIFCTALLALSLTSCEDNPGLGIPQTNPQEAIMSVDGVTLEYGEALAGDPATVSLADAVNGQVPVITIAEAENLPAGAEVVLEMQLASKADFSDATTLNVTDGSVSADAWDTYFREKLGKSPAEKTNYVRFAVFVKNNGQLSRLGTPETWLANKTVNVTPIPLDITLSDNYYLVGTVNGWNADEALAFNHSDINVYDDSNFSIIVEISAEQAADGWWWKVLPTKGAWDGQLGPAKDGDEALEGKLVDKASNGDKDPGAGCIKQAGKFLLTINVMDMTYKFQELKELYTPGSSNGWSQTASQVLNFDAESGIYRGFAYLDGEFKITTEPNWDGTNYGDGGEGKIDASGGNLKVAEAGLYYLSVDLTKLEYTATKINTWGLIGGFNGWGGDEALAPVEGSNFLVWQGTLTLADASDWKFRANGGWDINLGGDKNNLSFGGSNINSAAGKYTVKLDLSKVPYSCTVTPVANIRRK